jgi:hypothetical protein
MGLFDSDESKYRNNHGIAERNRAIRYPDELSEHNRFVLISYALGRRKRRKQETQGPINAHTLVPAEMKITRCTPE